jgi:hypothetical protein
VKEPPAAPTRTSDEPAATVDADGEPDPFDPADVGTAVPRQRALTLVSPPPPASTVRGVTPEGLPQRIRPSGRGDRAVRIAPVPAPDDGATDSPVTTAPVRTDGDATGVDPPRTPERMRTMLTSFQDGTALGRRRRAAADAVPAVESNGGPEAADRATEPAEPAEPADLPIGGDENDHADTGEAGGPNR